MTLQSVRDKLRNIKSSLNEGTNVREEGNFNSLAAFDYTSDLVYNKAIKDSLTEETKLKSLGNSSTNSTIKSLYSVPKDLIDVRLKLGFSMELTGGAKMTIYENNVGPTPEKVKQINCPVFTNIIITSTRIIGFIFDKDKITNVNVYDYSLNVVETITENKFTYFSFIKRFGITYDSILGPNVVNKVLTSTGKTVVDYFDSLDGTYLHMGNVFNKYGDDLYSFIINFSHIPGEVKSYATHFDRLQLPYESPVKHEEPDSNSITLTIPAVDSYTCLSFCKYGNRIYALMRYSNNSLHLLSIKYTPDALYDRISRDTFEIISNYEVSGGITVSGSEPCVLKTTGKGELLLITSGNLTVFKDTGNTFTQMRLNDPDGIFGTEFVAIASATVTDNDIIILYGLDNNTEAHMVSAIITGNEIHKIDSCDSRETGTYSGKIKAATLHLNDNNEIIICDKQGRFLTKSLSSLNISSARTLIGNPNSNKMYLVCSDNLSSTVKSYILEYNEPNITKVGTGSPLSDSLTTIGTYTQSDVAFHSYSIDNSQFVLYDNYDKIYNVYNINYNNFKELFDRTIVSVHQNKNIPFTDSQFMALGNSYLVSTLDGLSLCKYEGEKVMPFVGIKDSMIRDGNPNVLRHDVVAGNSVTQVKVTTNFNNSNIRRSSVQIDWVTMFNDGRADETGSEIVEAKNLVSKTDTSGEIVDDSFIIDNVSMNIIDTVETFAWLIGDKILYLDKTNPSALLKLYSINFTLSLSDKSLTNPILPMSNLLMVNGVPVLSVLFKTTSTYFTQAYCPIQRNAGSGYTFSVSGSTMNLRVTPGQSSSFTGYGKYLISKYNIPNAQIYGTTTNTIQINHVIRKDTTNVAFLIIRKTGTNLDTFVSVNSGTGTDQTSGIKTRFFYVKNGKYLSPRGIHDVAVSSGKFSPSTSIFNVNDNSTHTNNFKCIIKGKDKFIFDDYTYEFPVTNPEKYRMYRYKEIKTHRNLINIRSKYNNSVFVTNNCYGRVFDSFNTYLIEQAPNKYPKAKFGEYDYTKEASEVEINSEFIDDFKNIRFMYDIAAECLVITDNYWYMFTRSGIHRVNPNIDLSGMSCPRPIRFGATGLLVFKNNNKVLDLYDLDYDDSGLGDPTLTATKTNIYNITNYGNLQYNFINFDNDTFTIVLHNSSDRFLVVSYGNGEATTYNAYIENGSSTLGGYGDLVIDNKVGYIDTKIATNATNGLTISVSDIHRTIPEGVSTRYPESYYAEHIPSSNTANYDLLYANSFIALYLDNNIEGDSRCRLKVKFRRTNLNNELVLRDYGHMKPEIVSLNQVTYNKFMVTYRGFGGNPGFTEEIIINPN